MKTSCPPVENVNETPAKWPEFSFFYPVECRSSGSWSCWCFRVRKLLLISLINWDKFIALHQAYKYELLSLPSYGDNSKAAVIRIGLKEMIAFANRFYDDVQLETFFESCGVADLITTCYGGRNRIAGEEFVKGKVRLGQCCIMAFWWLIILCLYFKFPRKYFYSEWTFTHSSPDLENKN